MRIYKTELETNTLNELKEMEEDCWIHLVHPTLDEVKQVCAKTGADERLISKVLDEEELSRIEVEGESTLIVLNIPYLVDHAHKNKYRTLPLGIIHTNRYIITIILKENKLFEDFENGNVRDFHTEKKTRFTIQLLLRISQGYLFGLDEMNKDIERQEHQLAKATKNQELIEMLNIEKSLVYFMGSLKYNQATLERLSKGNVIPFYEEDKDLLEDAMIESNQAIEMATIYKEIMASTTETYASIISNNLNVIMKFLAGITIVFSVPTMVASFMGMNVPLGDFATNPASFFILILISLGVALLIAYWLKKKDML
mgnify:FL=1